MKGNFHAGFLEEGVVAIPPLYSAKKLKVLKYQFRLDESRFLVKSLVKISGTFIKQSFRLFQVVPYFFLV